MVKINIISIKTLTKIFFLNLFLFPIYPDNLKPTFIVLFFISSIYFFVIDRDFNYRNSKKLTSILIVNSSIFIVLLFTLLYSTNISFGLKYIFRLLPLILFPISFFLLQSNKFLYSKELFTKAKLFFYTSTLVLFIVIFFVFYFKGYVTKNYFLNYSYRIIFQLGKYSMHPIYASLVTSISLIFSISLFRIKKYKLLVIFGNILLLTNLILLSRKSTIIIMSTFFIIFLFLNLKIKLRVKIIISTSALLLFILVSKFIPDISNRFNDLSSLFDNDKVSSTSLRLNIYNASIEAIKKEPFWGYGIGDVKEVLSSFEEKNEFFKGKYYNTHNQILGFTLASGIFGFIVFIFFLFRNLISVLKVSFEQLSVLILFILLMFIENVLDRQNGVIYFALFINYFSYYNELNSKE